MKPFVSRLAVAASLVSLAAAGADPRWPEVGNPPKVASEGSRDAAVVIGVERYFAVPAVPGAARNATDWYRFLVEGRGVPVERVHLLRDAQAAREGILEKIEQAARQVEKGGTLWVVFIGHGAPARDGSEGMFVGVDAQQTATSLYARSVKQSEVAAAAAGGAPHEVVAVVDACFSGRSGSGDALAAGLQPLVAVRAQAPSRVTTLSAGAASEFAGPLPREDRPAFSYLLLGALRGWGDTNHDGVVTSKEAIDYTRRTLAVLPIGRTQTPELVGAAEDLPLAHGVSEAAPDLAALLRGESAPPAFHAPEAPSDPGFAFKAWGYSTLGLAGGAAVAAVYKHTVAVQKQDEYASACTPASCPPSARALLDESNGAKTARLGFSIIGAALAGTAGYLLYRGYTTEASAKPAATLLVGPEGVVVTGTF